MGDNLKQKMLGAFAWSSVDRFGQQAVQLIIGLVLARLLSPTDYGLIGMIMIFIALSSVMVDGGFGQALIRKKEATQSDYSTIFFLNLGISVFLYLCLYFAAPHIALFYNQPQLTLISRVLFLVIIVHALYFTQYVIIVKELSYKSLATTNISASFISGIVGILMAIKGFAVWSIVGQQMAFHVTRFILFYSIRSWRPSLLLNSSIIKEFWHFSMHLLGTSILNVLFNNFYLVLIGKYYPLKQVGFFTQANKLSETVNYSFQQILQSASYPLLVQIQHDDERYKRVYQKMTRTIALVMFPLLFTIILVAEPLILTLLSPKWSSSIILFQLLCTANIFTALYGLNTSVLNSRGASKKSFQLELIKKGLILVSIIICFRSGINTMLVGFIIANFLAYGISMLFVRENIAYKIRHQLVDVFKSIAIALVVTLLVYLSKSMVADAVSIIQLSFQTALAGSLYIVCLYFFEKNLFIKLKNQLLSLSTKLKG